MEVNGRSGLKSYLTILCGIVTGRWYILLTTSLPFSLSLSFSSLLPYLPSSLLCINLSNQEDLFDADVNLYSEGIKQMMGIDTDYYGKENYGSLADSDTIVNRLYVLFSSCIPSSPFSPLFFPNSIDITRLKNLL